MQVDGGPLPHLHENCLLDAKKTISADSLKMFKAQRNELWCPNPDGHPQELT